MTKVSVIVPTHNRAHLLERALNSILRQTYTDFEIIVVVDGSQDHTMEVLQQYQNKAPLSVIIHPQAKGVCGAKNRGLDNIKGEWFTILDDDDEMVPHALEKMLDIPLNQDPSVDAVSCNCINSQTGEMSGKGLEEDQFLSLQQIIERTSGEFWGITKTSLLGDLRFNEALPGYENLVWYRINHKAKRYYIHEGLRVYHTENANRVSVRSKNNSNNLDLKARIYQELMKEDFYWNQLRQYKPKQFSTLCLEGYISCRVKKNGPALRFYYKTLQQANVFFRYKFTLRVISSLPPFCLRYIFRNRSNAIPLLYRIGYRLNKFRKLGMRSNKTISNVSF